MVLYEDLRIYTIWRTDMARAKASTESSASSPTTSSTVYSKSAEEWEILGELAERLHHFPEAIEAYQSCLRMRFSPKAMRAVVKMWEEDRKTENILQGLIRLIAWQYRWYSEVRARISVFYTSLTTLCSFRLSCCALCESSSRMKGLSRCGA